jgi:hypothetical protein
MNWALRRIGKSRPFSVTTSAVHNETALQSGLVFRPGPNNGWRLALSDGSFASIGEAGVWAPIHPIDTTEKLDAALTTSETASFKQAQGCATVGSRAWVLAALSPREGKTRHWRRGGAWWPKPEFV